MLISIILVALTTAAALASEPEPVQVELFADSVSLEPGGVVHVGVRLTIEAGWHVYWSNPGDAGLATSLELELPAGFEAGPVLWPIPSRFTQPGGIVGYGYAEEVTLARRVLVPQELPSGGSASFRAVASWLACRERCVLGEASVSARLSPVDSPGASAAALRAWRDSLPAGLAGGGNDPFALTAGPSGAPGQLTVWLTWRSSPQSVEWFPGPAEGVRVTDARVRTRAGLTRVDLEMRAMGEEMPSTLPAVVVATDPSGVRRGYEVNVDTGASGS